MTLTAQQKTTLNNEIATDPTAKGYAAFLSTQEWKIFDLMNAQTEIVTGIIDRTNLTKWAAKTGMRLVIEQEAANQASQLCPSAMSIIDVLRGSSGGIDLSDPDNIAMLNAWQASTKLSQVNRDSMVALAQRIGSRCDVLKLPFMTNKLFASRQ